MVGKIMASAFWGFGTWLLIAETVYEISYGGVPWWLWVPVIVGICGCFIVGCVVFWEG